MISKQVLTDIWHYDQYRFNSDRRFSDGYGKAAVRAMFFAGLQIIVEFVCFPDGKNIFEPKDSRNRKCVLYADILLRVFMMRVV